MTTPVKVIAQHFIFFEKMRVTLHFLVFNSLEGKDDPCKNDCPTFYPFYKIALHLTRYSVQFISEEGRPL